MSRCFPFPPPGFEYEKKKKKKKSIISDDTLIESIKREREKAEKERNKEKRREKKDKKEKEKKEKYGVNGMVEKKKQSHKKRHRDDGGSVDHKVDHEKRKTSEVELEKSGLSEEHGQPANVPNLCVSTDSTQNSSKRKKHSSPSVGCHNQSTKLRFRLSLPKHKDPEEALSKEQSCSTSGRTEIIAHDKPDIGPRPSKKRPCSISGSIGIAAQDMIELSMERSSVLKGGSLEIDMQLRDLIENWVPPSIVTECSDFDDQEWLFDTRCKSEAKRSKGSDGTTCENFSLWPTAYYLPEADVYALPFTLPY